MKELRYKISNSNLNLFFSRPKSVSDLKLGSRVCVFWSNKMNFLHPGIVTGFVQEEPDYVIVSTDDGDTRDVHIQQIRFAIMDLFAKIGVSL